MIKVGVADYGLNQWYGGNYGYADRLEMLKRVGFDGIERLDVKNAAEAVEIQADAKRMGMDFGTCQGLTPWETIRWSAALGKKYVWQASSSKDFDEFCRHMNYEIEAAAKYGVKAAVHNHLGMAVETMEQVEEYLKRCPDGGLILDDAHLAAAGGDPVRIIEKYLDRIVAVHVKDYVYIDRSNPNWWESIRFCELGAGEMGDINKEVLTLLVKKGYDGWVYIEHDTHLQQPEKDLAISREYMRKCGI